MARSLSLVSSLLACLVLPPFAAGCDDTASDSSAVASVRLDACQPVVLVLDASATDSQKAGARAAIELWNRGASTRLTVSQAEGDGAADVSPGATALPLHFRKAAALSHGFFDPVVGEVLINQALSAPALNVVIAHEVGHAFGLFHVTDRPSVMKPGNLDVAPTAGDVAELAKLWGTCAPTDQPPP